MEERTPLKFLKKACCSGQIISHNQNEEEKKKKKKLNLSDEVKVGLDLPDRYMI